MLAIDLCCGRGGWTRGLMDAGFDVHGYDVKKYPEYPGLFIQKDVREVTADDIAGARLIVASPPCTEFSRWGMPCWYDLKTLPTPDMSIVAACIALALRAKVPLILENVRDAQYFIGSANAKYGHFFLWGSGVPAVLPYVESDGGKNTDKTRSPSKRAVVPYRLARFIGDSYACLPTP